MGKVFCFNVAVFLCVVSASVSARVIMSTPPEPIAYDANRSYFVSADGSDQNNGRSEAEALKTLEKAVEQASKGAVKTITVIGKFSGYQSINNTGNAIIFITGKPDANENQKAVFTITIDEGQTSKKSLLTVSGGPFRFENIEISGNNTISYSNRGNAWGINGAGMFLDADVTLGQGVLIRRNRAGSGGGIFVKGKRKLHILDDAYIVGNTAVDANGAKGGGIYGESGSFILMHGGMISANTAEDGAGIAGDVVALSNGMISSNIGDGVYCVTGFYMFGGTIKDNTGSGIDSVRSYNKNKDFVILEGGIISYNKNGVYCSNFEMLDCLIKKNKGSGVSCQNGTFIMSGGEIVENKGRGVIYAIDGERETYTGAIRDINITGGSISRNTGGGISVGGENYYSQSNYGISDRMVLTIKNCIINDNTSTGSGGGVYGGENCHIYIYSGSINNNTAVSGGGVYAGGKFYDGSSGIYIRGGEINNNTATKNGGGVYVISSGNLASNIANSYGIYNIDRLKNIIGLPPELQSEVFAFTSGKVKRWIKNNEYSNAGYSKLLKNTKSAKKGNNGSTMSAGKISGNKAEYGAGVYVSVYDKEFCSFSMSGGEITNNESKFVGGGVYTEKEAGFNKINGNVSGNIAGDGDGADVFKQN